MNDADAPALLDARLSVDLYGHQDDVLRRLLLNSIKYYLLAWEIGCGKTIVAVRLYWGLLLAGLIGALLYLCPASIKQQVVRELRRWGPPGLRIQILQTRSDRLDPTADVVICNYDLLLGDDLFEQLLARPWLLLVIDESHLLRTPSAKRTKRVLGRQPCLASAAQRVIALTGTPVINSPLDLFPLSNRLFPHCIAIEEANGKLRRMQQGEFIEKYCTKRVVPIGGGRTIEQIVGGKNLPEGPRTSTSILEPVIRGCSRMSAIQPPRRRGRPPGARTRVPLPPAALGVEPLAVRVDQAAAMVGCGVSKMKLMIAAGTVESVKVGSMRLVKVASLRRLIGV